jgi:hypothetical protein
MVLPLHIGHPWPGARELAGKRRPHWLGLRFLRWGGREAFLGLCWRTGGGQKLKCGKQKAESVRVREGVDPSSVALLRGWRLRTEKLKS